MKSTSLALVRPAEISLFTADAVEAIVEREFVALRTLEQRAAEATAEAQDLERKLSADGIDPVTASWMLLRIQQYLQSLRREAEDDASARLASARWHAVAISRGELAAEASDPPPDARHEPRVRPQPVPWSAAVPAPVPATNGASSYDVPQPRNQTAVVPVAVEGTAVGEYVPTFDVADDRVFWPPEPRRAQWWRLHRVPTAVFLEVGAGVAAAAALATRFL